MLLTQKGEEKDIQFSWGRKTGVQYYESFTYNGTAYFLYDCVYVECKGDSEPSIGKLVKIFETPTGTRKVRVVWFFRPIEIQNWLGDLRPLSNELFLASGMGQGLSNVIPLEAINGPCSVICTSKDRRNTQPTEEELGNANFIFLRTFDVKSRTLSKKFPDLIANVEVKNYFNQQKEVKPCPAKDEDLDTKSAKAVSVSGLGTAKAKQAQSSRNKSSSSSEIYDNKSYHPTKSSLTGVPGTSLVVKRKHESASGGPNVISLKRIKLGNTSSIPATSPPRKKHESALDFPYTSIPKKIKLENHSAAGLSHQSKVSQGKYSDDRVVEVDHKVRMFPAKAGYLEKKKGMGTDSTIREVVRKPTEDSSKWFIEQPWEKRMLMAQEKGTLVLLGNLDPSFTSADVEAILLGAFKLKVSVKMIHHGTFFSLNSGQAFAIFKSREDANSVISSLKTRCLMLGDGRPLIARMGSLKEPRKPSGFVGHLTIDRVRPQKQRIEMREAVSTSHYSQNNTIEYEMALEWFVLQKRSDRRWKALYESQAKELAELKSKFKTPQ
ncbi:unnamed protein product [Cuscuta epithymum]|uniref:BAH domain-containing protein n=1 Tax=Cuscuta epithymum TaxID=186058 RepID=A0AAV0G0P4_9ASTE|nr:unnamed protein product [Cuscuta epithymum]